MKKNYCIRDGISYSNKFVFKLLEQLGIEFINEYSPKWAGLYRYDFYFKIDDRKYILEVDGGFHFRNSDKLKSPLERDLKKEKLAIKHNLEIIRIECDYKWKDRLSYIQNSIINSKLNELFDLSSIDYAECNQFALTNFIKVACDLKNKNPQMTTIDIAKALKVNKNTIWCYLKKGKELGWCNYNPKEENKKGIAKSHENCKKRIYQYTLDKELIQEFPSSDETIKYGFSKYCVARCCRGGTKTYKGYIWSYELL